MLALTTAHTQNNLKAVMQRAIKAYRLLIIDEIGYLPMNREQAASLAEDRVDHCLHHLAR